MKRSVLKPILFGVLFGAAAFFAPFFLLKAVFFFLIIGAIWRLFWWRRGWHGYHYQMVMADKIRSMSEEEYNEMKKKFNDCNQHYYNRGCGSYYQHRYGCYEDKDCYTDPSKTENKGTEEKK